jgi:ketosteroid isomerase-like protein
MATDNITLVREFLAAIDEWDFDGMRERLHPDQFTYRIPYSPEWIPSELAGRDAYIEFARQWSGSIDGTENLHDIELDTLASDPDTVIATYKNEFTITASGYLYKNDLIVIFKIVDGLIATFDERLDAIPLVIASGGSVEGP